jgi:P-type Ca2+ transporter type 2C
MLCTDKTGTLTENRMTIAELRLGSDRVLRFPDGAGTEMPEEFRDMVETGILASARNPVDPMEKAFHALGRETLSNGHRPAEWKLVHADGLRPGLLAMSQVWQPTEDRQDFVIAAKGAPEAIAALSKLGGEDLARLKRSTDEMAAGGLRVLGIARGNFPGGTWPESQRGFCFDYLGLADLADPLRPSVAEAVQECRSAGINVVMITGDHPATARAIARQAGLAGGDLLTGQEVEKLNDSELARRVRAVALFARILPEQKLRIVEALKSNGEIVAMTGDGVNDAPSLKAAHIGIAIGGPRDGCSARGILAGASGRRFRLYREIRPARSAHL